MNHKAYRIVLLYLAIVASGVSSCSHPKQANHIATPTDALASRAFVSPTTVVLPNASEATQPSQSNETQDSRKRFVDLFVGAPSVSFDPNASSDMEALIQEVEYYSGRGEGALCGSNWEEYWNRVWVGRRMESQEAFLGVLPPFTDFSMAIESPRATTVHFDVSNDHGVTFKSGDIILGYDSCSSGYSGNQSNFDIGRYLGKYIVHLESLDGNPFYVAVYFYGRQIGKYFFSGEQGNVHFSFSIEPSARPQVYYKDSVAYLLHFASREFIVVRCYDYDNAGLDTGHLLVSNTFRTDPVGRLIIKNLNYSACDGIVIEGEKSGIFVSPHIVRIYKRWKPFNNCPESRLQVGNHARVTFDPPLCSRLREKPDRNTGHVIDCIEPGGEMSIVGGPRCNNGWIWWQVQTDSGKQGWIAEGDGEEFWLERTFLEDEISLDFRWFNER